MDDTGCKLRRVTLGRSAFVYGTDLLSDEVLVEHPKATFYIYPARESSAIVSLQLNIDPDEAELQDVLMELGRAVMHLCNARQQSRHLEARLLDKRIRALLRQMDGLVEKAPPLLPEEVNA